MEVHHHAKLHHNPKVERIFPGVPDDFLAVTLGFLAENFREHLTVRAKKNSILKVCPQSEDDTAVCTM
jgi:hypothetical protein